MENIAVIIPCYNEGITIEKVVRDAKKVFSDSVVYVYDNNSTDDTVVIAKKAGAVVCHERKQGKGNVVRSMFREIDANCYILVDGDDTYPLYKAKEMAEMVLNQSVDMVVGDRLSSTYYVENKRVFHNFGNRLVLNTINRLFSSDINDVMTGFRAFSYDFAKTFPSLSCGFEIETEMTIHAVYNKFNVRNVVVDYKDRISGSVSKLNTLKDGFKVILTIISMFCNYKPLQFFGSLSMLLILLSMYLFIPIMTEFIKTGLVLKVPTLIFVSFMLLAAVVSFFAGLLLDIIGKNNRRQFEILRNIVRQNIK